MTPGEGFVEGPVWFGPAERKRYGWLSTPAGARSSLGVVLCPPFAEEARSAHRTFRTLGAALAQRGACALRVDYDGTGDSVGAQDDPGRVLAWQASVGDAIDELRAMGVPRVALVGMRLGATVGAHAAAARGDLDAVVLWDPCPSGRNFLREGQLLLGVGDYASEQPTDGAVDVPGFRYDAATVQDMRDLSLAALPAEPWAKQVVVLTRDGAPLSGRAARGLAQVDVEWATARGQIELLDVVPDAAQIPRDTLAEVVDRLTGQADEHPVPITRPPAGEAVFAHTPSGRRLRERATSFGPAALFGIVTEPLTDPDADETAPPWIVLVNVSGEFHIGPGRRWVDYAREWAALGFRCVRIDQSGLGDSPTRVGQTEDVVFDAHWLDDLPDVVDELYSRDGGRAPVAVFSLCSGVYSGLEAAMRREIDLVYGVNPGITVPVMSRIGPAYDHRRRIARPMTAPFVHVERRNSDVAWGLWRIYRQLAFWHAPMSALLPVLRRGTTLRIVANRRDAAELREVLWWSAVRRFAVARTRRFHLTMLPELDHSLLTQQSQEAVYADATRFLSEHYAHHLAAAQHPAAGEQAAEPQRAVSR